jgi:hypothetical protein
MACLRRIVGVSLYDRHRNSEIHRMCGTRPLKEMIRGRVLQWAGHVMRMPPERPPAAVFDCTVPCIRRPRGRPKAAFLNLYSGLLKDAGVAEPSVWLNDLHARASDRASYREHIRSLPGDARAVPVAVRRSERLTRAGC